MATKRVSINSMVTCTHCKGRGKVYSPESRRCGYPCPDTTYRKAHPCERFADEPGKGCMVHRDKMWKNPAMAL